MTKDKLLFRLNDQREAARAVVDSIPERFFRSPSTTFADLAMGGGQYLAEVLRRCEKYHSREQILPRLFGFEKSRVYLNCALDYNGLDGANISSESPFELTMKFDVIIGNPPFSVPKNDGQNLSNGSINLALQFAKKASELVEEGGFVCLITPPNMLKPTDNSKPTNRYAYLGGLSLIEVENNVERWFPKVGATMIRWSAQKINDSRRFTLNGVDWDLNEIPFTVNLESKELLILFKRIWRHLKSSGNNVKVVQKYQVDTVEEGWSCVERVNRGREKDGIISWSSVVLKEKLANLHINLTADEANKVFSSPVFRFFTKATYVEPTLYKNLFNGLNISPIELTQDEQRLIDEYLNN